MTRIFVSFTVKFEESDEDDAATLQEPDYQPCEESEPEIKAESQSDEMGMLAQYPDDGYRPSANEGVSEEEDSASASESRTEADCTTTAFASESPLTGNLPVYSTIQEHHCKREPDSELEQNHRATTPRDHDHPCTASEPKFESRQSRQSRTREPVYDSRASRETALFAVALAEIPSFAVSGGRHRPTRRPSSSIRIPRRNPMRSPRPTRRPNSSIRIPRRNPTRSPRRTLPRTHSNIPALTCVRQRYTTHGRLCHLRNAWTATPDTGGVLVLVPAPAVSAPRAAVPVPVPVPVLVATAPIPVLVPVGTAPARHVVGTVPAPALAVGTVEYLLMSEPPPGPTCGQYHIIIINQHIIMSLSEKSKKAY
ncbi:hypothetical protein B0H16DRAFT_1853664 [Mycena metata]|uniref:Uncharacterized protein n=1 Tax=Mycena metata TaxID=1033252 RepID=A0AAD7K2X9_9AGAR|nr:hypothetical protein B0H16DRAFT_1853664 [Mycena metata]